MIITIFDLYLNLLFKSITMFKGIDIKASNSDVEKKDSIHLNNRENNDYKNINNSKKGQISDDLNKNIIKVEKINELKSKNELKNMEDLLINIKKNQSMNNNLKDNGIIEVEKEDINNLFFDMNNYIKKLIKVKEELVKLFEIKDKKIKEIENLEKKRKELIEFNENIEKYKNEYENKLKKELEKERNKLENEKLITKYKIEKIMKNYKQKYEDLKKKKNEFEKEKEDFENGKLEFEKEKQKFKNNKNKENNNENNIQNKNDDDSISEKKEPIKNYDTQEDCLNEDINNNKNKINEEKYEEPSSTPKGLLNLGLNSYMNSLL